MTESTPTDDPGRTPEAGAAPAEQGRPTEPSPQAEAPPAAPAEAAPPAEGSPADEAAPAGDGPKQPGDPAKKRRRRRGGSKVAEAWGMKKSALAGVENATGVEKVDLRSSGEGVAPGNRPKGPPRSGAGAGKPKGPRRPPIPREKGPLPFQELRDVATMLRDQVGAKEILRDAFPLLADKERNDLSELVSGDGDFRKRARSISAGALGGGNLAKALAAQTIAISAVEDLWSFTLSKEEAAERQAWIRRAKQRDEQRAKRNEERANRADKVSREDMAKARDGSVGAKIRFVVADEKRERKPKKPKKGPDPKLQEILERMGY